MSLPYRTSGNSRPWETRQSDHVLGNRLHWHGPIQGMDYGRPGFVRRIFGAFRR